MRHILNLFPSGAVDSFSHELHVPLQIIHFGADIPDASGGLALDGKPWAMDKGAKLIDRHLRGVLLKIGETYDAALYRRFGEVIWDGFIPKSTIWKRIMTIGEDSIRKPHYQSTLAVGAARAIFMSMGLQSKAEKNNHAIQGVCIEEQRLSCYLIPLSLDDKVFGKKESRQSPPSDGKKKVFAPYLGYTELPFEFFVRNIDDLMEGVVRTSFFTSISLSNCYSEDSFELDRVFRHIYVSTHVNPDVAAILLSQLNIREREFALATRPIQVISTPLGGQPS